MTGQPHLRVVTDDAPLQVLDALERPGPTAVVDHRRPSVADALAAASPRAVPDGTWLVATTSGSTGAPRAVCRTRASWSASVDAFATATGTGRGTRVLVPGPLCSTMFLHAAWHARQVGAQPVLADGALPLADAVDRAWDVAHLVPHLLADLLDAVPSTPSTLGCRTVVVAGAALPTPLRRRAEEHGLRVVEYYGAAELSFVALADGHPLRPFPAVEVQARDGVLWVRSPYLSLGYAGVTGASGPWQQDADGWSTVGDRGSVQPDGSIVVQGRGAAAVQTGGATVHVADVEALLRRHGDVTDAVVVGRPHARLGQVVAAAVESSDATLDDVRAWSRAHLDAAARPRHWVVVPRLPRTASGKVDRLAAERLLEQPRPRQTGRTRRHQA